MSRNQQLDSLYKEIILEHTKDPRNFGDLQEADVSHEGFNPLCGDRVKIKVKFCPREQKIDECKFQGEGCSICMASASIMTEEVQGRKLESIRDSIQDFRHMMIGQESGIDPDSDMEALSGVKNFPVRIKCALLPWITLRDALDSRAKVICGNAATEKTRTE